MHRPQQVWKQPNNHIKWDKIEKSKKRKFMAQPNLVNLKDTFNDIGQIMG